MSVISLAEHRTANAKKKKRPVLIGLPVAPQVVARTRFSPLTPARSQCLLVPEALDLLADKLGECRSTAAMAVITGPGDPLATPDITLHTIRAIHERYPDLPIALKTLGVGSDKLAGELARAGLTHVEIQVDAVQSDILEKLYAWIRPGQKTLKIAETAKLLIGEQRHGVPALKFHNIKVIVNTTLYPGYNLLQVGRISSEMMELGADGIALTCYSPEPGAEVSLELPTENEVAAASAAASRYLPLVDALILSAAENGSEQLTDSPSRLAKPSAKRPNVAVVSSNGMDIDLHLGQANRFLIYGPRADGLACLLETREAPAPGDGPKRWQRVATTLHDCFALLAASAGETPRQVLAEEGLRVIITSDGIEGIVDVLYGGGKKKKKRSKS
jgi:nitrogen fixation protein NifB